MTIADPTFFPPCNPWTTAEAAGLFCGVAGSDTAALDDYVIEASQILFELSGRQFNGVCEQTVRPCSPGCPGWGLNAITGGILSPGAYAEGWGYGAGFQWGGLGWINDNGLQACGCGWLSEIDLAGYPVIDVSQVKIDGAVIDTDGYRLDENRYLVRLRDTDGDTRQWPACQNLDLPDTEPGTWSVTYTAGTVPPMAGIKAAQQLACELYRATPAGGGNCSLPAGTTRVTRQGIQVERLLLSWLAKQNTGLVHVDAFLAAVNPNRIRRRAAIFSPDVPRFGRHVGGE